MKNLVLSLFLGTASTAIIPLKKQNLSDDMLEQQFLNSQSKYGGNEHVQILNYQNSEYYIEMKIGTPEQTFKVVPDTIRSNIWVFSKNCWSIPACWNGNPLKSYPWYESKKSSTFHKDGSSISMKCVDKNISGIVSEDLVKLGDMNATMKFAEITKADKDIFLDSNDLPAGVLGLGFGAAVNNLKTFIDSTSNVDKSFSIYLHNNPEQSYMSVPGYDSQNWQKISTHRVIRDNAWVVGIDSIQQQNQKKIPVDDGQDILLDISSAWIIGPNVLTGQLIDNINVAQDCSNIDTLPSLSFFLEGRQFTLEGKDYVLKSSDNKCQIGIKKSGLDKDLFVLGQPFIKKYPVYFNYDLKSVSFLKPIPKIQEQSQIEDFSIIQ